MHREVSSHHTKSTLCPKLPVFAALFSGFLVFTSCNRHTPVVQKNDLGTFHVDTVGSSVESAFQLRGNVTNCTLGFEVHGIPLDATFAPQFRHIVDNLSSGQLRLQLQFFSRDSATDFYRAAFPIGQKEEKATTGRAANFVYSGQRVKDFPLFFFAGIKPLGVYRDNQLQGDAQVAFHSQEGELAQDGTLFPDRDYRVRVTVLSPITITNEFHLILYRWH
jgi:hypothetical protein